MSRQTRLVFLIVIGFLNAQTCLSQLVDTVDIQSKFDFYRSNTLVEKIYVHTDRSCYLTGETIWFKLYYVDGMHHKPLQVSKVVYVEILDNLDNAVLRSKISLNDSGTGDGNFLLPTSLRSGNYTIRAYTNWMKNFSADFYFQEQITIINPFVGIDSLSQKTIEKYDIQFFPEGGSLVSGLTSKIAFRAVNQDGIGINFSGCIVTASNDTIVRFQPLKYGIGSFFMSPLEGETYRAIVRHSTGSVTRHVLPTTLSKGYIIQVMDTTDNRINVIVKSSSSLPENEELYVMVHSRQIISISKTIRMHRNSVAFSIDQRRLPEGISHFTIFNSSHVPVCERLYFKEIESILHIESKMNKGHYNFREKVKLKYTTLNSSGNSVDADLSVAVYRIDSLQSYEPIDITAYLKLTSDLVGNIEDPGYYLKGHRQEVDNLMLTHGWRRFQWNSILDDNQGLVKREFIPELKGPFWMGRVLNRETKSPVKGVNVHISVPQESNFRISKTNERGEFLFETTYFGKKRIIIQTNEEKFQIELLNPYSKDGSTSKARPDFNLTEDQKNPITLRSIHMQVQNAFYDRSVNDSSSQKAELPFFGNPDKEYLLDDYTRFPTMEEVLREYVPEVFVRKRKDDFNIFVFNPISNSIFDEAPLIVLDGTPVFSHNKLLEIDPLKIRMLQVVTKKYFYAGLSFGGVVSYNSYKSDLGGYQVEPSSMIINYENLSLHQEFFSPVYDGPLQRTDTTPDTRSLLFWDPYVEVRKATGEVEFYTSDISGKYRIVMQGLTTDGLTGTASVIFDVSKKDK